MKEKLTVQHKIVENVEYAGSVMFGIIWVIIGGAFMWGAWWMLIFGSGWVIFSTIICTLGFAFWVVKGFLDLEIFKPIKTKEVEHLIVMKGGKKI